MKKRALLFVSLVSVIILTSFTSIRNDFFEIAKQIEIFTTLYKEVNMNYVDRVNPGELMNAAIVSMLKELDPYTQFYNEQDVQNARINQSGRSSGIGASVIRRNEEIIFVDLKKDGAADKAGIQLGDRILKIDDIEVKNLDTDVLSLLQGAPNTKLKLVIKSDETKKEIQLTRKNEEEKAVPYIELLKDNSGYIVLNQFSRTASKEVEQAVKELKDKGATKIILDLRNNPGGLLSEAVNISNIFLPKDVLITFTRSAIDKYNAQYTTTNRPVDTNIPLAVLINDRSASASEIVSGSIQDLDRGVIIGARSFGKGLVQRPKNLNYGTSAKITISRYYTPSGRCIQALNYKKGEAIRKEANSYTEFKTRNGRSVFDGGGIQPDIEIDAAKRESIAKALYDEALIFDFATQYYRKNKLSEISDFEWSNNDWKNFENFIKETSFSFETPTEIALKEVIEVANEEGNTTIKNEVNRLKKVIEKEKVQLLERYRPQIERMLTDEILRHYFYEEGVYQYATKNAKEIKEAQEILNNPTAYNKLLGK